MVKNAVDVIIGGLSYWMFGYALRYEMTQKRNIFTPDNGLVNEKQTPDTKPIKSK